MAYSKSSDGMINPWGLHKVLEAQLLDYKASKNSQYLKQVLDQGLALRDLRDDRRGIKDHFTGKSSKVWSTKKYTCGKTAAFLLHSTIIMRPILESIDLLLKNHRDELTAGEHEDMIMLANEYSQTMNYFFLKDRWWRNGGMTFLAPTQKSFKCSLLSGFEKSKGLPLNQVVNAGDVYLRLSEIANKVDKGSLRYSSSSMKAYGQKVLKYTLSQLKTAKEGHFLWKYSEGTRVEDTSHALITYDFLIRAYERKLISSGYISKLKKGFHFLYNGHYSKTRSHLSSTVGTIGERKYIQALTRFSLLGKYDSSVAFRIKTIVKNYKDTNGKRLGNTMRGLAGVRYLDSIFKVAYPVSVSKKSASGNGLERSADLKHSQGVTTLYAAANRYFRVSGKAVTSCALVNFGTTQFGDLEFSARHRGKTRYGACKGRYCGTSPGFHLFVGKNTKSWKRVFSSRLARNSKRYSVKINDRYRYGLACRSGGGSARDNIDLMYLYKKLK